MKTNGHESVAAPVIEKVAARAHQVVDKAAVVAEKTADRLVVRGDALMAQKDRLLSDACGYVSANPLKAIGIAAVAGFLLSRIIL